MAFCKTYDVLGLCAILLIGCGESSPNSGKASDQAGGGTSGAATGGAKATGTSGATAVGIGGSSAGATTVPATGGTSVTQGGASNGGTLATAGGGIGGTVATGGTVISQAGAGTGGNAAAGAATGGSAAAGGTSAGGIAGSAGSTDAIAGNSSTGGIAGTAGAAGASESQAGAAGASPLSECFPSSIAKINVVALKDAAPSGADSEGRMWVGGNLTLDGGFAVNATNSSVTTTCTEFGLVVGGNVVGDPIVSTGKFAYGGTFIGNFSGTCGIFHTTVVDFGALDSQMKNYSAALGALAATGTAAVDGLYLLLSGASSSLNVFSITAAQLAANSLKIAVPDGSTVLVNISGTSATWTGKGFSLPDGTGTCKSGTSTWCLRILYNFYQATALYASGIGIQGSVLAPYATLDGGGANVDGQVIVNNLKGGLEYHPYMFNGCLKP